MAEPDEVAVEPAEESPTTPLLLESAAASPSVEVRLYRQGSAPAAVFRSGLVGPRRDRLDVRGIQADHGLRALFAFNPSASRRGLRIRPDPNRGGLSALPFRDGAAIALDGEPKASWAWTKPAAMVAAAVLAPAAMAAVALYGVPEPLRSSRLANAAFAPWILASVVIVVVRLRTRPRARAP